MVWKDRVVAGVTQIIASRRGHYMAHSAKINLSKCLELMEGTQKLIFDWDISLYTSPPPLKAPRPPSEKVGAMTGEKKYPDFQELDIDDDNNDLDAVERPTWNIGEVHIARIALPPYWAMVR